MRYAFVINGVIDNVIDSPDRPPGWVACGAAGPGWLQGSDGKFVAPPPPPDARHITVGAFYDRFGAEKYPILASTDRGVIAVIRDVQVRSYIDLDRDDLPAGLAVIQAAGHQIDPTAILDAPVQPEERP
ncbi:hypothetical protein [Xylophilus ampelinus]|uniref:Uncharacterized protein n=1 Tax=Xylophilus ampelinus TaxID=54067 RepID=A0A318SPU3_9BURK|nr:hypothetical protein [Xylophilus ampelinus]MCS4508883.1 hypothetical protein [Xylophilus ampelinus]PYE79452.1 hypothetical protein DFQ15_102185 [Xylophilus ampelinus]